MLEEALAALKQKQIKYLQLRFVDNAGIIRAKTVLEKNFVNALTKGINFSKAILSYTAFDQLIDGAAFDAADGDFWAVPDLASLKFSTYQPNTAYVYCDLKEAANRPFIHCQRTLLKTLKDRVQADLGGSFSAAFEPEFIICTEGGRLGKSLSNLFSVQQLEYYKSFLDDMTEAAQGMGLPLIQISSEASPLQFEINLAAQSLLEACDNWLSLREMVRMIAARHGHSVTFLPKPYNGLPGNGLHLHIGLTNGGGNLFYSHNPDQRNLSELGRNFIGGLLAHSGAVLALGSASVNSYKRLNAGNWAPTHVNWGIGNRASFIRIPEKADNIHLEIRSSDATCSPYLFMSGVLAAGQLGVKKRIDPGMPNGKTFSAGNCPRLPMHLAEAIEALEKDEELNALVGSELLKEYIAVKRAEWNFFINNVSSWDTQFFSLF